MKLEQGARIIVEDWIHAQPEDVLHFITDETKLREAEAFVKAAQSCGAIPKVTVLPSQSIQPATAAAVWYRYYSTAR